MKNTPNNNYFSEFWDSYFDEKSDIKIANDGQANHFHPSLNTLSLSILNMQTEYQLVFGSGHCQPRRYNPNTNYFIGFVATYLDEKSVMKIAIDG